jgi:hypothetical protein
LIFSAHLLIEKLEGNKIRLVLCNNQGTELACRKSTTTIVNRFLKGDKHFLFKGRLKLIKHATNIQVLLKENIVLEISCSNFNQRIYKTTG